MAGFGSAEPLEGLDTLFVAHEISMPLNRSESRTPRAISCQPPQGCMSYWRTVSIEMKDDQIAALNLRLKQLGFETMGDYARALTEGVVGNRQLVDDLAEAIAEKMVVKMTTTQPIPERLRTDSERADTCWAGSSAVECLPRTQEVRGSNPLQSTKSQLFWKVSAACKSRASASCVRRLHILRV